MFLQVSLVGYIRKVESKQTKIVYTVEDHTGWLRRAAVS